MMHSCSRRGHLPGVRRQVHSHALTLVPASLLPLKGWWKPVANALPPRDALIIVPSGDGPIRRSLVCVAAQLRAEGRCVTTLPVQRCDFGVDITYKPPATPRALPT